MCPAMGATWCCHPFTGTARQTGIQTDTHTERQRHTHTHRETETHTHRDRDTHTETDTHTQTDRHVFRVPGASSLEPIALDSALSACLAGLGIHWPMMHTYQVEVMECTTHCVSRKYGYCLTASGHTSAPSKKNEV
jgi:hypothetical protein